MLMGRVCRPTLAFECRERILGESTLQRGREVGGRGHDDGVTPAPTIPRGVDQRIQRRENNNFDLLRLLAAAQVIYLHSVFFLDRDERGFLPLVDFVASVFPGVPIFFVISGFLVSQSYERSHGIRDYARKRALRIFPALWICFAVTLALLSGFFATPCEFPASDGPKRATMAACQVGSEFQSC